jgi:hypothetical protein
MNRRKAVAVSRRHASDAQDGTRLSAGEWKKGCGRPSPASKVTRSSACFSSHHRGEDKYSRGKK